MADWSLLQASLGMRLGIAAGLCAIVWSGIMLVIR
jgi:hypothetical protein